MEIQKLQQSDLPDFVNIFLFEFSDETHQWNYETAHQYLLRNLVSDPDFCLGLSISGQLLGSIFCLTKPYYSGRILFIDAILVKKEFRHRGVGNKLIQTVIEQAQNKTIDRVQLLGRDEADFEGNWYARLGFQKTGWIELEKVLEKRKI